MGGTAVNSLSPIAAGLPEWLPATALCQAFGVPGFAPFPALRYHPDIDLSRVTAPPYDVLHDTDVDALQARDEHNITHVDVPRPGDGADPYELAGRRLRSWIEAGVLVADPRPSYTLYRTRFTDAGGCARDIVGVFGALQVVDPAGPDTPQAGVLPHERTTHKASTDRLDLTHATNANLSAVWGLSLSSGLTKVLQAPGEPMGRVVVDGVEHIVERVSDVYRVAAITAAVRADDVLIADGHHRYGVAQQYRDEVRAATGRTDTAAESTLAFVGELVADQLSIEAIHRLYDGLSAEELTAALAARFEIAPTARPSAETLTTMSSQGHLVLLTPGPDGVQAFTLTPKPAAFEGVRKIDGALLEVALASTDVQVSYQHGLPEMLAEVAGGRCGVLIRPVAIAEIERTAREGLLMPPKSTFFTPKLRTGLVVRPLG